MKMKRAAIAFMMMLAASTARADDLAGCWEFLSKDGSAAPWVTVHGPEADIFHIEVGRLSAKPPGYERLAVHLAITREALKKSLGKRSKRCKQFYPEMYESEIAAWNKANAEGRAKVCDTSIADCLAVKAR
jgi:hypothetical protein